MPSPWSQDLYIHAYKFAARAHRWQLYPGTTIPYLMHLSFVSMEIIRTLEVETIDQPDLAVQCALLHDTLEDTRLQYDDLLAEFGASVAQGVLALTVHKQLPRPEQMPECLVRIKQQPREIWIVKLADRITNLQPPPPHWRKPRIREYHSEALLIHQALQDASPFLARRLLDKITAYADYAA